MGPQKIDYWLKISHDFIYISLESQTVPLINLNALKSIITNKGTIQKVTQILDKPTLRIIET